MLILTYGINGGGAGKGSYFTNCYDVFGRLWRTFSKSKETSNAFPDGFRGIRIKIVPAKR